MTWVMFLLLIVVFLAVMLRGGSPVPWLRQMYRARRGSNRRGDWMAPEEIVQRVRQDYLTTMAWLQERALEDWERQWAEAPGYLDGAYLRRHQRLLVRYRLSPAPRLVGVLRADHEVTVYEFSDDGERCLVVDHQRQRRMATYDYDTRTRITTQDLGDCAVVYQMVFDLKQRRWKIEAYIQELPSGWDPRSTSKRIKILPMLPTTVGRDN